jgi:glycosyltransferase involved in cell wall biosynthesis
MKILFDASCLQGHIGRRGIGRYAFMLASSLIRDLRVTKVDLLFDRNIEEGFLPNWSQLQKSAKVQSLFLDAKMVEQNARFLKQIDNLENYDLIIFPNPLEGDRRLFKPAKIAFSPKHVFIIHDLIPLENRQDFFLSTNQELEYMNDLQNCLQHAIYSNSLFTKSQILKHFPNAKVLAILGGPFQKSKFNDPIMELENRTNRFLLSISGDHPRKNAEGLIRSWARIPRELRRNHPLVIVAGGPQSRRNSLSVISKVVGLAVNSEIFIFSEVSEGQLEWLYQNCFLNIMPSFEEGLGMPVLEARIRSKPSIGSNTTSLPEVLITEKATFDPYDETSIAERIHAMLAEPDAYHEIMRSQLNGVDKFTWEEVVDRLIESLEKEGRLENK